MLQKEWAIRNTLSGWLYGFQHMENYQTATGPIPTKTVLDASPVGSFPCPVQSACTVVHPRVSVSRHTHYCLCLDVHQGLITHGGPV